MLPGDSFSSLRDGGAALSAALDGEELARWRPIDGALSPQLSPWDAIQNAAELDFNQSDCNWFAFDAQTIDRARRFAGILALHRTGPRFASLGAPSRERGPMPKSLRSWVPLLDLLPVQPRFDARPLYLAVLYDFADGSREACCHEEAVEGAFAPERFSFVEREQRYQLLQGRAEDWQPNLPPILSCFYGYKGPAFALRAQTDRFEIELFLRPDKQPVAYGSGGGPALYEGQTVINYVQRPRLQVIGSIRQRSAGGWSEAQVIRGDATQDRHWMTARDSNLRWLWLMARLDDGRECMAYELRTADGGRDAPADAGRVVAGGAWLVDQTSRARAIPRAILRPLAHRRTMRGLAPTRTELRLPDEDVRLTLEHEMPTFVPTRALGESGSAGIWESPARLIDARGVTGGRFWVDYMPPFGGA